MIGERWWQGVTLGLAGNSVVFGVLGVRAAEWAYALGSGFLPAALLVAAVFTKGRARAGLAVVGAVPAATTFWMIYPVALAAVVIAGALLARPQAVSTGTATGSSLPGERSDAR